MTLPQFIDSSKLEFRHFIDSTLSLATAAWLAPARVRAAESGVGALVLDNLEKIARVLGGEGGGPVSLAGADGGGAFGLGVVGRGGV